MTVFPIMFALLDPGMSLPVASSEFLRESVPKIGSRTSVEFFVDPDGKVLECEIEYPVLDEDDRVRRCAHAIGQTIGEPARDAEGFPAYGIVSGAVVRQNIAGIPPRFPSRENADLEIVVLQMPDNQQRVVITILLQIDESGRVMRCRQLPGESLAFSEIACRQSMQYQFKVRRGIDREPVPYVTGITVNFLLESESL